MRHISSMTLKKRICLVLVLIQLLFPIHGTAMTIGEERMISEQLLYSVRSEFRLLDQPDISQYINDLGNRVLTVVGPQFFDYHFFVVKSDQFNAFAAPGGLVFFYTGLIETMKSEDELLSVLAHEIGHVVSRHIAQRIEKTGKVNVITMGLGLAALALGNPALSQGLFTGSLAAGQAINLHYSRTDEEQADRLSFDWMQKMHRNPMAMEGMLRTMRRITRYRSGELPQYLLTHPNPEARMSYVQSLLDIDEKQKLPDFYKKPDNFQFLRFKYRVMFYSVDFEQMRLACINTVTTSKDPEQVTMAEYGLSLLALEERNYDRSMDLLEKVRAKYPEQDILDVDKAVVKLSAGQTEEALDLLQYAVKRDPTDMYATFELAKAQTKLEKYSQAELLLKKVGKSMPEYPQLYYELARIKAAEKEDGQSRFYLGKYNLYEGKIDQAKEYFRRSEKDTTIPESLRNEASAILARLKELEKA